MQFLVTVVRTRMGRAAERVTSEILGIVGGGVAGTMVLFREWLCATLSSVKFTSMLNLRSDANLDDSPLCAVHEYTLST